MMEHESLWYHPESECYVPIKGEVPENVAMECMEVTPDDVGGLGRWITLLNNAKMKEE